ncbi:hypothetical protein ACFL5Z_16130 [Planctomycetota bacterium]
MLREIRIVLLVVVAMTVAGGFTGCGHSDPEKGQSMPNMTIEQVLQDRTDQWMAFPGVEGTAIGLSGGKSCIKIFTSIKPQELRDRIPSTIEGYPVVIEEMGIFRALEKE